MLDLRVVKIVEIVENPNGVAVTQQAVAHVIADESGAAGDQEIHGAIMEFQVSSSKFQVGPLGARIWLPPSERRTPVRRAGVRDESRQRRTLSLHFIVDFVAQCLESCHHGTDPTEHLLASSCLPLNQQSPFNRKIKIDRSFDRSALRYLQKATVIQFRKPSISFRNVEHDAGPRLINLPE